MSTAKRLFGAFAVGGAIGLVTQILLVIAQAMVGSNFMVSMPVCLLLLGIVTAVLIWTGAYKKIEAVGQWGATLPFSGLVSAICDSFTQSRRENGVGKALLDGSMVSIVVLFGGGAICIVVGVILSFFVS